MFVVDNKFNVGEECYSIYRGSTSVECPICEGTKKILYKGYTIHCNKCSYDGKIYTPEFVVCKVKVKRIRTSRFLKENGEEANDIRYVITPIEPTTMKGKKREEGKLFKTREEAEEFCKFVNAGEVKLQKEI